MIDRDAFGPISQVTSPTEAGNERSEIEAVIDRIAEELASERSFLTPVLVLHGDKANTFIEYDVKAAVEEVAAELTPLKTAAEKSLRGRTSLLNILSLWSCAALLTTIISGIAGYALPAVALLVALLVATGIVSMFKEDAKHRLGALLLESALRKRQRTLAFMNTAVTPLNLILGQRGLAFRWSGEAFYAPYGIITSVSADRAEAFLPPRLNITLDLSGLPGRNPKTVLAFYYPNSDIGADALEIANHIAKSAAKTLP